MVILIKTKSLKIENSNLHSAATDFRFLFYFLLLSIMGILLSILFMLGSEMSGINKNDSCFLAAAAATILTGSIIMATSSMMTTPAAAATTTGNTTTTVTIPSSTVIQLSRGKCYRNYTVNITTAPRNANADTTTIATNVDFLPARGYCWRFEENCLLKYFFKKHSIQTLLVNLIIQ